MQKWHSRSKKSTSALTNIEKLGRIGVIIGLVSGVSVAVLSLVMFLQASSKLKLLTQTNTELLTVFVENVDTFNENLLKLEPVLNNINKLTLAVDKMGGRVDSLKEKSEMSSTELRVAIEKMTEIAPTVEAQMMDLQEKTSIMNSELTLSLAEMTTEEFKAQNMIMGNFTRSVIEAMQNMSDTSVDAKEQQASMQKLQDVNAELSARIATLDQKLESAKREAARVRNAKSTAKTAKPAQSGDIIKYP
jgi:myosin heavy subunit